MFLISGLTGSDKGF